MSTLAFDAASIQARIIAKAQTLMEADGFEGATFLFTGTNMRIIQAISEELADDVYYDEQLTREATWGLAENVSSINAQTMFYNYVPHRKVGASGNIRISSNSLFAGSHPLPITIPRWNSFSGGGLTFTCTGDPDNDYADYALNSQDQYVDVHVVQGLPKVATFEITQAAYSSIPDYVTITINDATIENSTYDVFVNGQLWSSISNLRLASSTSQVYAVQNALDFSTTSFKFGNGIFGMSLSYGDVITIKYVSTEGSGGDVSSSGIVTAVNDSYVDSSSNVVTMYCSNVESLSGGQDYENIEDIRAQAPQSYQTNGRALTSSDYQSIIEGTDIVRYVMAWGEAEENEDLGNPPGTYLSSQENVVHVTGFNIDSMTGYGNIISSAEQASIRTALNKVKGTTDIVQFIDTQFVYIHFTSTIYVSDRAYVPSQVTAAVYAALQAKYALGAVDYYTDLYASKYKAFIDSQPGVDHHTTTVSFVMLTALTSAYQFTTNLNMANIVAGSVKIYVKGNEFADWTQMAHDVAASSSIGNLIGDVIPDQSPNTFQLPNATISYSNGAIGTVIVTSGLTGTFANYSLKVTFNVTPAVDSDVDVILTKRQQIVAFYDASLTSVLMT